MEKPVAKSMSKILKFLPKAAQAAVSFQNPPFSPVRDKRPDLITHKFKTHFNKGFSGPMIPAEARSKSKNFETQEPTSPKVSCMGQIKQRNKICKNKNVSQPKEFKIGKARPAGPVPELKKKPSGIKKIFSGRRKSDAEISSAKGPGPGRAPSLSQMRKFASSRDTLANFDWTTARIAPEEDRDFDSDEERGFSDGEEDFRIPFSAPILTAGGGGVGSGLQQPRKEINLWKRRTMTQPKPLQLSMLRAQ